MEEGVNNKVGKTQMKRKGSYIIDGKKGEKKESGRAGGGREEGSHNNSLVLPLYSDKFPARWGVSAPAEAGPVMNHLHPAPAIYDRETNMSWPGNQLGLVSGSHCHRVTTSK